MALSSSDQETGDSVMASPLTPSKSRPFPIFGVKVATHPYSTRTVFVGDYPHEITDDPRSEALIISIQGIEVGRVESFHRFTNQGIVLKLDEDRPLTQQALEALDPRVLRMLGHADPAVREQGVEMAIMLTEDRLTAHSARWLAWAVGQHHGHSVWSDLGLVDTLTLGQLRGPMGWDEAA